MFNLFIIGDKVIQLLFAFIIRVILSMDQNRIGHTLPMCTYILKVHVQGYAAHHSQPCLDPNVVHRVYQGAIPQVHSNYGLLVARLA